MRGKRDIRLEAKWQEIVSGHPCNGQTKGDCCKGH